jgi:hypothetical protein
MHTSIFQNFLGLADSISIAPIYVGSQTGVTSNSYSMDFSDTGSIALADAEGTGYYLARQTGLHVERRLYVSRDGSDNEDTQAFRAIAWLNHGVNPTDAAYEFVMLPNHSYSQATDFRTRQDAGQVYEVLSQTGQHHIVHDLDEGVWGYALYENLLNDTRGPLAACSLNSAEPHMFQTDVAANPGYAVVLQETDSTNLQVSLAYLDLRLWKDYIADYGQLPDDAIGWLSTPVTVRLEMNGELYLAGAVEGVTAQTPGGGKTVIDVIAKDGMTVQFDLSGEVTDIKPSKKNAHGFTLISNPWNHQMTFRYTVAKQTRIQIELFSSMGRNMITVMDEIKAPGTHGTVFSSASLPVGIYLCRINVDGSPVFQRQVIVLD